MSRTRWSIAALVALSGLGLWRARAPDHLAKESRPPKHDPVMKAAEPTVPPSPAPRTIPANVAPRAPLARTPGDSPAGEVVGAHPHAPHLPGMVPHPHGDPTRERLHDENRLIQSLNDAMSFRRVVEMRALLAEYRKLDPSDVHSNQAGYAVIIDCIESPSDASLAAARKFYDTERHSPLRRFVRRICFENTN